MPESYVFISHKSEDKPRVRPIVEALLKRGLGVWIDNPEHFRPVLTHANLMRLRSGQNFRKSIAERIAEAGCVLVIWSERSIGSPTVCDEASRGLRHDKLVPVRIDSVEPPLGFGDFKTSSLVRVQEETEPDGSLAAVIDDVEQCVARRQAMLHTQAQANANPPVRIEIDPTKTPRPSRVDHSLTYMLDREHQVIEFATYISREVRNRDRERTPRAGVVLLAAPHEERPDTFLESLCHRSRDSVRDLLGHEFDLIPKPVGWPECGSLLRHGSATRQLNTCINKIGAALNVPQGMLEFNPQTFRDRLNAGLRAIGRVPERAAAVLTTPIYPDRWTRDDERLLRNLIGWWQDVELDPSVALPVLVVAVVRPAQGRRRLGWFWKVPDIASFFDDLTPAAFPRLNLLKLGSLDRISVQHANNWLDHILPKHLDVLSDELEPIRRAIAMRFAEVATQPLDEVAVWLQELLSQSNLIGRATYTLGQRNE